MLVTHETRKIGQIREVSTVTYETVIFVKNLGADNSVSLGRWPTLGGFAVFMHFIWCDQAFGE